jgi:hypothetical protein
LPVVLYGCEICSLNLREEHRLRAFESRALRRIVGLNRDEVGGACGTNGGEEERVETIARKARSKELIRKSKT